VANPAYITGRSLAPTTVINESTCQAAACDAGAAIIILKTHYGPNHDASARPKNPLPSKMKYWE
jgi:hypothetical protein